MAKYLLCIALFLLPCSTSIAADYSGLWWDSTMSGQGFSIIQDGSSIYGAWYLYDEEGQPMWLVFNGTLSGNSVSSDLLRYVGPAFDGEWDQTRLQSTDVGSISITFSGLESAAVNYQLYERSGSLQLEPFANDSAVLYWDPSKPGQGVGIFTEGSSSYGVWYLYDKTGRDLWVTMPSVYLDGSQKSELLHFRGPRLGSPWNTDLVKSVRFGNVIFEKTGNSTVSMDYQMPFATGILNLVPFGASDISDSNDMDDSQREENQSAEEQGTDSPTPDTNSEAVLVSISAYVDFSRDGGLGDCGQEPWLADDCTSSKDWWGIDCYLVVHIAAIAIKDGDNRWVITNQEDMISRFGFSDEPVFSEPSSVYYDDLELTYVTPPCIANISGIGFEPGVLGTVENGIIDLTYLGEPQIRVWGSCGQATFDWTTDALKYAWGMAVSGDPMDLTGKIYLDDKQFAGSYEHKYSVDTNPSPDNRDHADVTLGFSCISQGSTEPNGVYRNTACPWE